MKISVIIPTCDRPDYLIETIESILGQTLPAYEIIVVNNGQEPLDLPDKIFNKVTVYNIIPYAGVAQARNFGASLAKGEYLAFLDDDDLWNRNYLENIAKAMQDKASCIISRLDKLENERISSYKNAHNKLTLKHILFYNPGITGSNIAISKDLFFKLNGFDPKLPPSEDKSLILEALKNNIKITTLPDNQAIIRMHQGVRLSDFKKIAEGAYQFTYKYKKLMNQRQYIFNLLKIYRHRYKANNKKSFIPFVFLHIVYKIIKHR